MGTYSLSSEAFHIWGMRQLEEGDRCDISDTGPAGAHTQPSSKNSERLSKLGRVYCGTQTATSAYLDHVVVEMLGVAVDQVNLLGVRVVHLLFSHLVCHGLVVGLVDVTLVPDGNSVEMSL